MIMAAFIYIMKINISDIVFFPLWTSRRYCPNFSISISQIGTNPVVKFNIGNEFDRGIALAKIHFFKR